AASEIQRRFEERAGLQAPPQPVEIVALGTTLPARCSLAEIESTGDWAAPWRDTATIVQGADLAIANLEAVPSDLAEPYRCQETFSFLTPAAMAQGYAFAGLDVVSLANNHSRDFGGDVLLDGIANLRAAGVQVVGAGANAEEASAPLFVDVGGVRFAFLAYDNVVGEPYAASHGSPGTSAFDETRVVADIRAVRSQADAVVVMLQWGLPEYYQDANAAQRAIAAAAVEAGADYVYGDGPHVPQGLEFRDGAFVHYSLGNFIFDQDWCEWTQVGSILRLTFHGGRPVAFRLVPYRIADRHRPVPLSGADADAVVALIADATRQPSDAPARLLCEG
ncbi:MAG TPA: CapA family protein, partial [Dehalococcoidia bacterium]|nr:CapA family protein [Dehalococcoidia bacterium]